MERGYADAQKRLTAGLRIEGQDKLVAQNALLGWIVENIPAAQRNPRTIGKLNLLRSKLQTDLGSLRGGGVKTFEPATALKERLKPPGFGTGGGIVFLSTIKSGQAYIDECALADVPIPPTINLLDPNGTNGWKTQGFIPRPQQFIVGTPAEVRTYETSKGMCIALPRYDETDGNPNTNETATAILDGVICLSKITSKVCFWDNQKNNMAFDVPAGQQIPIGLANLTIDPQGRYQAGGAEIEAGAGGICTDCHAGENPYIVHPDADLGNGLLFGDLENTLPMFGPQRYIPIVGGSWPQNTLSMNFKYVPGTCEGCHTQGGAGRIPHLYDDPNVLDEPDSLVGYCGTILAQAVSGGRATMPTFSPGSMANDTDLNTMRDFCGVSLTSGPSDRGDPHLVTTNGTSYDFQAAGEFVALRNPDTGFELQTRQTPVTTTFIPGPNPYTGLASCVSLNTAAGVRLGKQRLSYQLQLDRAGVPTRNGKMEIRLDGQTVAIPAAGLTLADGTRVSNASGAEGIELRAADGTRVRLSANFWASQGYRYLDIDVLKTTAREGTMGTILPSQWLPLDPNGGRFGPAPVSLQNRHALLNQKFANAWRVRQSSSLFDYAPGTTTATYTDRNWPAPPGQACTAPRPGLPVIAMGRDVRQLKPAVIGRLCARLKDPTAIRECIFDMTVMGDPGIVNALEKAQIWSGTN